MSFGLIIAWCWYILMWTAAERTGIMDYICDTLQSFTHSLIELLPVVTVTQRPSRLRKRKRTDWLIHSKNRPKAFKRLGRTISLCLLLPAISGGAQERKAPDINYQATYQTHFDSDSSHWRIDNGASRCISNNRDDFVQGTLRQSKFGIRGYHTTNKQQKLMQGTLKCNFNDEQGISHTFRIPNSLLDVNGSHRILSPQHWARTRPAS